MNEKILLVPNANGTELIRTMARFGVNTIGLRIVNSIELAEMALMDSGLTVSGKPINNVMRIALIDKFIRTIPYFETASYRDSGQLAAVIDQMRLLVIDDESKTIKEGLAKGEFLQKNDAVLEVYRKYEETLRNMGYADGVKVIRQAIANRATLRKSRREIIILDEYKLSNLESKLAEVVSDGNVTTTNLIQFMGKERTAIKVDDYCEGYGSINEIKGIIAHIVENNIPLDQCTIVLPSSSNYIGVIRDLASEYSIDIACGCGVPIVNTAAAQLLKLYYYWEVEGWQGINALENLLLAQCFNTTKLIDKLGCNRLMLRKVISKLGALRIGNSYTTNKKRLKEYPDHSIEEYPYMLKLARELEEGVVYLLRTYTKFNEHDGIEKNGIETICNALEAYAILVDDNPMNIVDDVLLKSVYREQSRPGAIYVTGIESALASVREHIFICGLDANSFPGAPTENYILLDSDMENLGNGGITSKERISRNKETLVRVIETASALDSYIWVSYSNFNLAEMREQNPSSSIYEIYRLHKGQDKLAEDFREDCPNIGFFQNSFDEAEIVASNYLKGFKKFVSYVPEELVFEKKERYSPSAIGEFFQCGIRFWFNRIAGLYLEEPDNPLETISAADFGTLAHSAMEDLAAGLGETAEKLFDEFMKTRPAINSKRAEIAKREFLDMMNIAYKTDARNEVLMAEEELEADCYGVRIYGRPDRIEKGSNGQIIIVDFKTGKAIRHEENDINTCLQAVLYAYMAEQAGYNVDHCEFRYLRSGNVIKCKYDEDIKGQLKSLMVTFKSAIENNEYTLTEYEDVCKYCLYGHLCGKEN